jgi:hypothetical protein
MGGAHPWLLRRDKYGYDRPIPNNFIKKYPVVSTRSSPVNHLQHMIDNMHKARTKTCPEYEFKLQNSPHVLFITNQVSCIKVKVQSLKQRKSKLVV